MTKLFLLLQILLIVSITAQTRIYLNEDFSDWENVNTSHADAVGDQIGSFDFKTMWISNDDNNLYIRIQTGKEIVASDDNYMTLYIDADNNSATGKPVNGIGAEVEYTFGTRSGKSYLQNNLSIDHRELGLLVSPTVTSKQFEIAIDRDATVNGERIFNQSNIKIAFISYFDYSLSDYADKIPDNGGVLYTFESGDYQPLPNYSIKKQSLGFLRTTAYNVEQTGILAEENSEKFNNIFDLLQPEIIGFSEIYDGTSQQVADRMEFFLPSENGEQWYHKKNEWDIVLASRFPIKDFANIYYPKDEPNKQTATGAFLLNLRPKYETDLLIIVSHPKCCSGDYEDDKRQNQIDALMQFVRESKNGEGEIPLTPDTPIIIMGDMNFVGENDQQITLLTGDIDNNTLYGESFEPDWDGTSFEDSMPFVTNTAATYTTNPGSYTGSFPSGRLDYTVYSGSVLEVKNSFVLNTATVPEDTLTVYGLSENDTHVSDHLPVVVDFDLSPVTDVKKKDELPNEFKLMQNYPNPFNPSTTINFSLPTSGIVTLAVYDILGRKIETLINKPMRAGVYEVDFDASKLTSGVYLYSLTEGSHKSTRKMLLVK